MQQYGVVLYMVVLVGIFYFMIIRPQQQNRKKQQDLLSSLDENMKVTTIGGLLGTIIKVKETTVILKIADNTKVEVLKSAIAYKTENEKA